jgi:hypothetical protein
MCKKFILIIIFCICVVSVVKSQDTILLRNGNEILAKVLEIGEKEIIYKIYDYPDGLDVFLSKQNIFMIKFQNGTKKNFVKKIEQSFHKHQLYPENTKHHQLIKDSITYKNAIAINVEALLFADFKITYTHELYKRLYFEIMASYNIPLHFQNSLFNGEIGNETINYDPLALPRDPYYGYGRLQIRVGLKEYLRGRFYMGEIFLYNYGHFNNLRVANGNTLQSDNEEDIVVNRVKNDYEILLKYGLTYQHKSGFLLDLYMGIGWRLKYLDDTVYQTVTADSNGNLFYSGGSPNYPFHQSSSYSAFELHGGLQIGFGK